MWHVLQMPVYILMEENESLWFAMQGSVICQDTSINVEEGRAGIEIKLHAKRPQTQQHCGFFIWIYAFIIFISHSRYKWREMETPSTERMQ